MRQHICMHAAAVDKAYFSGAEGFKGVTKFNMHFTLDNESKLNARTTSAAKDYRIHPENFLTLKPSRWIPQKDTVAALKEFVASEPLKEDQLFYMWGAWI